MPYKQYKFKFYLNSSHSIIKDGVLRDKHPHTWEISLHIVNIRKEFVPFGKIEKSVEEYFSLYQNKYLNEIKPFDVVNPTLENMADYFKDGLSKILNDLGWVLILLEMSETPSRTYVISLLDDVELSEDQTINAFTDLFLERLKKGNNG